MATLEALAKGSVVSSIQQREENSEAQVETCQLFRGGDAIEELTRDVNDGAVEDTLLTFSADEAFFDTCLMQDLSSEDRSISRPTSADTVG